MNLQIQRASRADAWDLAKLNQAFNQVDTPVSWIEEMLTSARTPEIVYIARSGSEAVGFGCLKIAYSMCYERPIGEISELFVVESQRRKGIGKGLVEQLIREARSFGTGELYVGTEESNEAGHALYRSAGFQKTDEATYIIDMW